MTLRDCESKVLIKLELNPVFFSSAELRSSVVTEIHLIIACLVAVYISLLSCRGQDANFLTVTVASSKSINV